jgi:transglutaminase-like putative cysteine protease
MRRECVPLPSVLLFAAAVAVAASGRASARPAGAILHEPIPPDPREDLALNVALDGDLPAALETSSGIVAAPNPRQLPRPSDSAYGPGNDHDTFMPDRETRRPEVGAYDDPFTPATAPFKRFQAFDGVRKDYRLYVRDERLVEVAAAARPGPDDVAFYADLVVDMVPDRSVRIPSVGPGARIVRARLGIGADELPMRVMRDGVDNWFLQVYGPRKPIRARLVMEVVIARAAFGGDFGDPAWSDLPSLPPLPASVARESAAVRSAIGVSRGMRPRQAIAKLVQYFRGFADADDPPGGRGSIYLDLALSKKGVCRHRAFAFLVTAQGLGIPARMIVNEAHAWVEVYDGTLWRRIDLGGAGRLAGAATQALTERPAYEPPPDGFAWPHDAQRGGDIVAEARALGTRSGLLGALTSGATTAASASEATTGLAASASSPSDGFADAVRDDRPPSVLSISAEGPEAHCGRPLPVHGDVRAEGEMCPHVAVELWLRVAGTQKAFLLGALATGDDGRFAGAIVVPTDAPLGDYEVLARTRGDARCGAGSNE